LQARKNAKEKLRRGLHRAHMVRGMLLPYTKNTGTKNTGDGAGQVLSTAPNKANYRYDLMVP